MSDFGPLTPEKIAHFQKRAKHVAVKRGYPELADDFSQEIFIAFARGWHSTLDQLFTDYLRKEYGNTRTPGGLEKRLAKSRTVSLDEPCSETESGAHFHELIADPRSIKERAESDIDFQDLSFLFTGRQVEIFSLYYLEEWSTATIGDWLGLTESRISQLLKLIKKEIQNYFAMKELRDRLQWDSSFGVYQVEWIRI